MKAICSAIVVALLGCATPTLPDDAGHRWNCLSLPWPTVLSSKVVQVDDQIWFFASVPVESWRVDVVAARWSEAEGFTESSTVAQLRTRGVPRLSWNGALLIDYAPLGGDSSVLLVYHPSWPSPIQVLATAYSRRPDVVVGSYSGTEAWVLRDTPYLDNVRIGCKSMTPELFRATSESSIGPLCPFESALVDVDAGLVPGRDIDLHPSLRVLTRPGCDFGLFGVDGGLSRCVDAGMPGRGYRRFWPSPGGAITTISMIIAPVPERQNKLKIAGLKLATLNGESVSESWLADESVYSFDDIRTVDAGVLVLSSRAPRSEDGIVWLPDTFPRPQALYLFSPDGTQLLRSMDVMPEVSHQSAAEDEQGIIIFGEERSFSANGRAICYFRW